ncbi:SusD/RagB family nutrient-binding outer membrane lipoprotein [Tenacibaculum soleae]|uniref:SusD/RagB family nutrient-binding outer membrane lipoprotein n=1 Tax=Tenacibaculum soleae TaxID=447689 RepID=UPI0023010ECF|nr:SusD/RagB family nutrient-binding outer membrane lipoprotein [Tenacibaculum soleae]
MIKIKKTLIFTMLVGSLFTACDTDYINDPDSPKIVPTSQLFNNAAYDVAYNLNDQWVAGRGTLSIAQYWGGTEYTEENRYALRTNMVNSMWNQPYFILTELQKVIELNENADSKDLMSAYGDNNNQIQVARILMSYTFIKLVDTFGDVPYWSYGQKDNPDFQALKLPEGISTPKYTDAKTIYVDLLAELKDAADKLNLSASGFKSGDNIYDGDVSKWRKLAHSLRLRLASHILKSDAAIANQAFNESDALAFSSNADNADFVFGTDDLTGGPWHQAVTVGARRDFAPSISFVELLYNRKGPFQAVGSEDPRVEKFFEKRESSAEVIGVPSVYGKDITLAILNESTMSPEIIKADFAQPLFQYAEVEFIRSEFNSWSQANYENGVKASMEYWGVPSADITSYVAALPAASEETVLTQKYIGLFMDGLEGWTEYRRSGYPNTLDVPGDVYNGVTFTTLITDLNTIPNRVNYPANEQLLNKENRDAARDLLSDGDTMISKIFWDVN